MKKKRLSDVILDEHVDAGEIGLFSEDAGGGRVRLPLKAVDARFQVEGDCAEIVVEQIYEYTGRKPVDVLYTFPLPADASVHRCEMRIGSRVISAKVKPVKEARKEFKKQKAAGRRAALVESVRENLFELRLGNIQPGDHPVILIAMAVPLCQGAAFIVFDEAEKVAVASAVLEQAAVEPGDWDMNGISTVNYCCCSPPAQVKRCLKLMSRSIAEECDHLFSESSPCADEPMPEELPLYLRDDLEAVVTQGVSIFAENEWKLLLADSLLPWAGISNAHKLLLDKLLRELAALGKDRKKLARALQLLRGFKLFTSGEVADAIEAFCKREEKAKEGLGAILKQIFL